MHDKVKLIANEKWFLNIFIVTLNKTDILNKFWIFFIIHFAGSKTNLLFIVFISIYTIYYFWIFWIVFFFKLLFLENILHYFTEFCLIDIVLIKKFLFTSFIFLKVLLWKIVIKKALCFEDVFCSWWFDGLFLVLVVWFWLFGL